MLSTYDPQLLLHIFRFLFPFFIRSTVSVPLFSSLLTFLVRHPDDKIHIRDTRGTCGGQFITFEIMHKLCFQQEQFIILWNAFVAFHLFLPLFLLSSYLLSLLEHLGDKQASSHPSCARVESRSVWQTAHHPRPALHACKHLTQCTHIAHVTHSNLRQLITLACTACMMYTHTWNTLGLYAHAHSNLMFICTGATVWPASTLLFEAGRSVAAGLM